MLGTKSKVAKGFSTGQSYTEWIFGKTLSVTDEIDEQGNSAWLERTTNAQDMLTNPRDTK